MKENDVCFLSFSSFERKIYHTLFPSLTQHFSHLFLFQNNVRHFFFVFFLSQIYFDFFLFNVMARQNFLLEAGEGWCLLHMTVWEGCVDRCESKSDCMQILECCLNTVHKMGEWLYVMYIYVNVFIISLLCGCLCVHVVPNI